MQFQTWNLISIQQMSFSVIGLSFVSPFFLFSKLQAAQLKCWWVGGWCKGRQGCPLGGQAEATSAHLPTTKLDLGQYVWQHSCTRTSCMAFEFNGNVTSVRLEGKWTSTWALEWWPRPHYPSGSLTEDEWDHCGSSSPPNLLGRKSWLHPLQLSSNQHCAWTL